MSTTKIAALRKWVAEKTRTSLAQHSAEWLAARKFVIGGSSIATVIGQNPYSDIAKMVHERLDGEFTSSVYMQWGNLFEDVIKEYCEIRLGAEIIGEDLFLPHGETLAFSPDGLGVVEHGRLSNFVDSSVNPDDVGDSAQCTLFEFKCPFARIPGGRPPSYYVPQVKMGLDIIEQTDIGVLVEGVFRLCSWADLGLNLNFSELLQSAGARGRLRSVWYGNEPRQILSLGVIGFYFDASAVDTFAVNASAVDARFIKLIKFAAAQNTEKNAVDLISLSEMLSEKSNLLPSNLLNQGDDDAHDGGDFLLWVFNNTKELNAGKAAECIFRAKRFSQIVPTFFETESQTIDEEKLGQLDNAVETFLCSPPEDVLGESGSFLRLGILPWKLLKFKAHLIEKERGYLTPHYEKIKKVVEILKCCAEIPDKEERARRIDELCAGIGQ